MRKRDTDYRGSIATKLNILSFIDVDTFRKRNKEKSWEYRKYKDIDPNFICISKDGTINSTLLKIGGLIIATPSIDKNKIINKGKSNDLSFWERTEIPDDFLRLETDYSTQMAECESHKRKYVKKQYTLKRKELLKKHAEFVDNEFYKRKYGFHIKIDDEIFYLTGSCYTFLNYYFLVDSDMYPLFRTTAVYTWLHWEGVKADSDVFGEIRFKSRRVSWTSEASSEALNYLTSTRYGTIPIVSERKDLAKELFESKIVDAFKHYPTYFKPVINDPNALAKSTLEIIHDTPKKETSRISFYPTKLTAYDSTRVKPFAINDEIFKFEDISFTKFRARHKYCYNKSKNIHPKGKFGSTTGDKGVNTESASYEWKNADPLKRDPTGSTKTKLVALFVDCVYTWGEEAYFDKWGFPIVHDPKEPILNELDEIVEFGAITRWNTEEKNAKSMKKSDLNSFYRNQPRTIEHALRSEGGVHNDFDIDNLNNAEAYINKLTDEEKTKRIFRGNFRFKGEKFKSEVEWIQNPKGKFQTSWIPPKKLQNKYSLRRYHGKDIIMPDNNDIGCLGVDSYDIIGKLDKGSDGSIVGYTKFNMTGSPTNSFILIYKERPDRRNDFFDDVIMACMFYGFYALIESNKARLLEYMYDNGVTGFSMRRPDKAWKDLSPSEKLWGGIPSSTPVIEDQTSGLKDYILDFVGVDLDNDCKVLFIELIQEWKILNPSKRKEFDLGVASGMAKAGARYNPPKRQTIEYFENEGNLTLESFGA